MSFSYGFFNAQNLDRVYTAEDFTAYLSSLICNGILDTYRQCFAPTIKIYPLHSARARRGSMGIILSVIPCIPSTFLLM